MRCALAETTRRERSTPRAVRPSISRNRAAGSTTTPLPMTGVQPGVSTPLGSRWVANFTVDHDRVAGVVAAGVADAEVDGRAEKVGRLPLALVTPLGSEHHDRGHGHPFRQTKNPGTSAPGSCGDTL